MNINNPCLELHDKAMIAAVITFLGNTDADRRPGNSRA